MADCFEIANLLCREFKKGRFGHVELCYTMFISMLTQRPSVFSMLPLKDLEEEADEKKVQRDLILYEPTALGGV